jgi:levansucrase
MSARTMSVWRADHLRELDQAVNTTIPVIRSGDVISMVPGYDLWDVGPVRTPTGDVATLDGDELWLGLSAPAVGDPGHRHDVARLRLIAAADSGWRDMGALFPDGSSLGSREWAASATYDQSRGTLDVLYTATGSHDGSSPHFTQRIVATSARVVRAEGAVRFVDWRPHREVLGADGVIYERTDAADGAPGFIKAFRDPFPFRDPADGREWLLFTGSQAGAESTFNGVVGLASPTGDGGYRLEEPLLGADGVNNELERPHIVVRDGNYYLFFSTQRRTFAPGVTGPNGLYGFVAPSVHGPYLPINGSGLVLQNPADEPVQAYSWLVLPDLRVASFIDFHSLDGRSPDQVAADGEDEARKHFGGTIAPIQRLTLEGSRAALVA